MTSPDDSIEQYFTQYEEFANTFDPDLATDLFADHFIGAGPSGIEPGENDDEWREAFIERGALYDDLGFGTAEIRSLDETWLDEHYVMVKVHWHMLFEKEPGEPQEFEFDDTYFLHQTGDDFEAVFWISHGDEWQTLQEAGLLPPELEESH